MRNYLIMLFLLAFVAPVFAAPVVISTSSNSADFSSQRDVLVMTSDGTLWTTIVASGKLALYNSSNDGASWKNVLNLTEAVGTRGLAMEVNQSDVVFILYLNGTSGQSNVTLLRYDTKNPSAGFSRTLITQTLTSSFTIIDMLINSTNAVYMFYKDTGNVNIFWNVSEDSGVTSVLSGSINDTSTTTGQLGGLAATVGFNNTIDLVWSNETYLFHYKRYTPSTGIWSDKLDIGMCGAFQSRVYTDIYENTHFVCNNVGSNSVNYARKNATQSVFEPLRQISVNGTYTTPAIVQLSNKNLYVMFYNFTVGSHLFEIHSANNGTTWTALNSLADEYWNAQPRNSMFFSNGVANTASLDFTVSSRPTPTTVAFVTMTLPVTNATYSNLSTTPPSPITTNTSSSYVIFNIIVDAGSYPIDKVLLRVNGANTYQASNVSNLYTVNLSVPCGILNYEWLINDTQGYGVTTPLFNYTTVCGVSIPDIFMTAPSGNYNSTGVNTTIPLAFVTINNESIDSCWYQIDSGAFTVIPECHNVTIANISTTFTATIGGHQLDLYVNDTFNLNNFTTAYFTVLAPPAPPAPVTGKVTGVTAMLLGLIPLIFILLLIAGLLALIFYRGATLMEIFIYALIGLVIVIAIAGYIGAVTA